MRAVSYLKAIQSWNEEEEEEEYQFCRSMLRSLLDPAMSDEDLLLEPFKGSVHSRGRQPASEGGMAGRARASRYLIGWCFSMHLLFATIPSQSDSCTSNMDVVHAQVLHRVYRRYWRAHSVLHLVDRRTSEA